MKFYCKWKELQHVHNDEHKAPLRSTGKSIRRSKKKLKIKNGSTISKIPSLRSFKQSVK